MKPHHIYVFTVYSDGSLGTRRLFAAVGMYDGKTQALGAPNGIKVDTHGNVYIGSTDGVQGKPKNPKLHSEYKTLNYSWRRR